LPLEFNLLAINMKFFVVFVTLAAAAMASPKPQTRGDITALTTDCGGCSQLHKTIFVPK
jgi:hypothetical protein